MPANQTEGQSEIERIDQLIAQQEALRGLTLLS